MSGKAKNNIVIDLFRSSACEILFYAEKRFKQNRAGDELIMEKIPSMFCDLFWCFVLGILCLF